MGPGVEPDDWYDDYPHHPLYDVPREILVTARLVLQDGATWKNVDPEHANALADAVVVELLPWLSWKTDNGG